MTDRPRIVALLAWYDEDPAWLERAITALAKVPVNHLVAIDGAYSLWNRGRPRSALSQYEAIHRACWKTHIGLTLHIPETTWAGNECEKRSKLFELGDQEARANKDWFLILDADEFITDVPDDLHDQLKTSVFDVANVTFSEPHPSGRRRDYPIPILFRAIPGIHVVGNHFTYKTPDGRLLWGNVLTDHLEPRLDLTGLRLDHMTEFRHEDRRTAAKTYYQVRDDTNAEDFECNMDGCTNHAKHTLPYKWKRVPDGEGFAANWCAVCPDHRDHVAAEGIAQLIDLGEPNAAELYARKQWIVMPGAIVDAAMEPSA